MSVNERTIKTSPDTVWDVLSDGWLYPTWVVGATRMRGVDETWPEQGSGLHHSAGVWPLVVNDETRVKAVEPGRRLELRAKGWPLGEADVLIELEATAGGTRVRIHEDAADGPGRAVPKVLRAPVMKWRNSETLRRLAFICEGRVERGAPPAAH
jgi:uncharacterized protein YndB with AHSA1/START domain